MLADSLSPDSSAARCFAEEVVRRLQEAGFTAYWAGGCVRDLLRQRTPKDYDVATDATPQAVRKLFGTNHTRAVGAAFGVILVYGPRAAGDIEVATFRAEGPYLDGRRPEHIVFCSAEEDAQRRDFTINGMFFDPVTEQVFDFVGGQADLSARVVRAIGDPHERFREDKLRMLRAIRFAATMDFTLEMSTFSAIREMAHELHIVSVERITQECKRMFLDPQRGLALTLARDTGLFPEIFREIPPEWSTTATNWEVLQTAVQGLAQPGFEVVLATLLALVPGMTARHAQQLARRLKFSNDEHEHLVWLITNLTAVSGAARSPLWRLKRLLAHVWARDLLAVLRAVETARGNALDDVQFCEDYLRNTPMEVLDPPPLITGNDLIQAGLQPGPRFRELLESLRNEQLDGTISTREVALARARELQASDGGAE